jgi:hypothetical protein
MMIIGRITKDADSSFWGVEIDAVGGNTQGRSRKEAFEMAADLIETMVNRRGFKVTVTDYPAGGDGAVLIESSDPAALAAYVLRYQRAAHGLSLADVQKRLGASSRTIYKRYETGESVPTIGKYYELLAAVAPEMTLVFGERGTAVKGKTKAEKR